jgi:hypothetical protein
MLGHDSGEGPHVCGCWVDLVLSRLKGVNTDQLHPNVRTALEVTVSSPFGFYWNSPRNEAFASQRTCFHDIFGNPFRPVTFAPEWRTDTAVVPCARSFWCWLCA